MKTVIYQILLIAACWALLNSSPKARAQDAPASEDSPTIQKDSLQVTPFNVAQYHGDYSVWSWVPRVEFRVNGPVQSGDRLSVEFKTPNGPWLNFDCKTQVTQKHHWFKSVGGGETVDPGKGITDTGQVDFVIHIRNELAGTDSVLFTGKFNVLKVHSNETAPNTAQHFCYYESFDWAMPIAYLFLERSEDEGMKRPTFACAFWVRGEPGQFEPHLFYQGKEVAQITVDGSTMGLPHAEPDISNGPTAYPDPSLPQAGKWERVICKFFNVYAWDKTGKAYEPLPNQQGTRQVFTDNPGDYEVKIIRDGHLARSIKFSVDADGKFDQTITKANNMGDDRAIVPVQIIGDQDGTWDHDAWKTDAFYGHPLTGFSSAP